MSQRRRTQKSQRQACTPMEVDEEDGGQASQNATLTDQEHLHHVSNVIKYILAADQSKIPIVRTKISDAVNCRNKPFKAVMDTAAETFSDVFGFKMVESDGRVMLVNKIKNDQLNFPNNFQNRYGLLFLVLAHIYMNGESSSEESLNRFLTKLGLIMDGNVKHDLFGNLHDLIYVEFVKEKYLAVEKKENIEKQQNELTWGDRAKHEVSPRSILEFMSQVYNGKEISSWRQQYESMLHYEKSQEKKNPNTNMVVE